MATRVKPLYRQSLAPVIDHHWQGHAVWILGAAAAGFAVSELFSSVLELSRNWFVLAYLVMAISVFAGYVRWSGVDLIGILRRHWVAGVAGGAIVGSLVAFFVINGQTASPRNEGSAFVLDILWLGVVYGAVDALLLNILPVLAVWQASTDLGHTDTWPGKIATGFVALLASLFVTSAYHLGYAEYRGTEVGDPLIGNSMITLSYLLTMNPIAALISHIALHVSSVVHGVSTTVTLPPHY